MPKLFRIQKTRAEQLERISAISGVDQQQIVQDALTLDFDPNDPGARAQRDGLLARLQLTAPAPAALNDAPRTPTRPHRSPAKRP